MNGKHYPLELHLVHRNGKYEDYATAIQNRDGLLGTSFADELKIVDDIKQLTALQR